MSYDTIEDAVTLRKKQLSWRCILGGRITKNGSLLWCGNEKMRFTWFLMLANWGGLITGKTPVKSRVQRDSHEVSLELVLKLVSHRNGNNE